MLVLVVVFGRGDVLEGDVGVGFFLMFGFMFGIVVKIGVF